MARCCPPWRRSEGSCVGSCVWLPIKREMRAAFHYATPLPGSLCKLQFPRVAFEAGGHCERGVKIRSAGADPASAGAVGEQAGVEVGDDHVVRGLPCFGED